MELNKLVIGDKVTDGVYCLFSMHKKNDKYDVVLKDKSGELLCELAQERFESSMNELVGGAVKVTFIIKNGLNTTSLGVIKSLAVAEKGSYKPSELFDGLSAEKIAEYSNIIKTLMTKIPDDSVRSFVSTILNDDTLRKLSTIPASLGYHARYCGGALATTACVTKFVSQIGVATIKGENGLYSADIDWSTLIAASLLQSVGMIDYITPEAPFRKTNIGVERGYMSVLQHKIEMAHFQNKVISDDVLARILNILASSVPMKSGVKATCLEGTILRGCLLLYEEIDRYSAELAGYEVADNEEYFYSSVLKRNISLQEREDLLKTS